VGPNGPIGSRRPEEAGHHVAGEPGGGVEAGCGAEGGQPVGAADALRRGEASAESVADEGLNLLGSRRGVAQLAASLAGPTITDRDGPVVEQVAAQGDRVVAVVVVFQAVRL
jgi:hypothetical protein